MQQSEYRTELISANSVSKGVKEFLEQQFPGWKPQEHSPETMMLYLNKIGEQGWELVSMQPVAGVGKKWDVQFQGEFGTYSYWYFCAFKRPKP